MSRTVGFYLSLDNRVRKGQRYITKGGAVDDAKTFLTLRKAKKVGVVRANDSVLLMTLSRNKDNKIETVVK